MPFHLRYQLRRLSARLHRLRIAVATRGWRSALTRVANRSPHGKAPEAPSSPAPAPAPAPRNAQATRILLIDVGTPRPDRDSGSMRAVNLMRVLLDTGFAVDFLPDDRGVQGHYTRDLQALGVTVHAGDDVPDYPAWLAQHGHRYAGVVVSRYHLAEFLFPLLRRLAPQARLVLDTVDLHHVREQREADHRDHATLRRLARGTRRRELRAMAEADLTWVVSEAEAQMLRSQQVAPAVHVLPNLHAIATGPVLPAARHGLLFVGGAGHPPNVDAVDWLVSSLFPAIRARLPACELHLVGDGLDALVPQPPAGVVAHGYVPELAPLLDRCRIGLAPLRFGAGVKGKVNLCMAAGLPVVLTPCAAEGMHLVDGRDALIAGSADAFCDAVVRLYQDEALWHALSGAGLENVRRHFSFEAAHATIAASFDLPASGP
ncbi:glycosyltransferase family 4 protein [Luteimonas sp. BDR2-5]|uniref:glycosyltransferase n=1 Tax=Proluteimonas luteida TaxID=2878685 RepID=UPI001E4E5C75|nr:glycosyltransferase [Luteimonas sp. BDR2-5]MCD9027460.1 glycosyltransferase family 4 protein [Luteimonas sp. BDR2-5]